MTAQRVATMWCAALGVEARAVRKGAGQPVTVLGMRARRRERLDSLRAGSAPVRLLGFGGGLAPGQRAGDIVVATEIRHAGGRVELPSAPEILDRFRQAGLAASGGPLWCSDRIVRGPRRAALAGKGAVAVDMESAAVAAACGGERLAVVRVLVDTPGRGLVLASILGGRRARRALRLAAAALAGEIPPGDKRSITSGTVNVAARGNKKEG